MHQICDPIDRFRWQDWCGLHRRCVSSAKRGGNLLVCGLGEHGQLGLGASTTKAQIPTLVKTEGGVVDVSCGKNHTVFATDAGKVRRPAAFPCCSTFFCLLLIPPPV